MKAEQTGNHYALLSKEEYVHLHEDYIHRELQVAFDQIDRGDVSNLDMDALLAEAHRRHAELQQRRG